MTRTRRTAAALGGIVLGTVLALGACSTPGDRRPPAESSVGDPVRGRQLIEDYGCGSCHTIPGVRTADGLVGPPLTQFGRRTYIAGSLVNSADNLRRWIRDPQGVEPGTAMPDLGVDETDAEDIAAYLLSLG